MWLKVKNNKEKRDEKEKFIAIKIVMKIVLKRKCFNST